MVVLSAALRTSSLAARSSSRNSTAGLHGLAAAARVRGSDAMEICLAVVAGPRHSHAPIRHSGSPGLQLPGGEQQALCCSSIRRLHRRKSSSSSFQ